MVYYKSKSQHKPSEFSPWGVYVNVHDVKIIVNNI